MVDKPTPMIVRPGSGGNVVDRATQAWVRRTGLKVSFADHPWLHGPRGDVHPNDAWLSREAKRLGGHLVEGGGLLDKMADLANDDFEPTGLAKSIVAFYEKTSDWRLEARTQWTTPAWPFGWLLSSVFARRLGQLNLPLRPLHANHEIDSRVVVVRNGEGSRLGAAWFRTEQTTGQVIYSGWYGTTTLPGARHSSLRVVFPLPNGSVTVFLQPKLRPDGALVLASPIGRFGSEGTYLVVAPPGQPSGWVRRVPLAEEFVISVDEGGTLRTNHLLTLWRRSVFQMDYRMSRS